MSKTDVSGLSQLGAKVDLPQSPEEAVLERVPSGNQGKDYLVQDGDVMLFKFNV